MQPPRVAHNAPHEAKIGIRSPEVHPPSPCEGAQIIARVGSDVILVSEVMPAVNQILAENKDRIPSRQLERQRQSLTLQLLKQQIEIKLIYQDAKRVIPAENLPKIEERLSERFETVEIPERMKLANARSRRELEEKLRQLGTSLYRARRSFIERTLAQQWAQQQIKFDKEIPYHEILAYYHQHLADYQKPARARWEQLMVRKSTCSSKAEAVAALAAMGNQVIDGAPFAEVASAGSEGITASEGGLRDWTTQGALVSEVLDQAIFGLPVGSLSRILEDEQGFHIIRVIEREPVTRTPFVEAQVEIREKLEKLTRRAQLQDYLARLKEEIPVWTVFDEQAADTRLSDRSRSPGHSEGYR